MRLVSVYFSRMAVSPATKRIAGEVGDCGNGIEITSLFLTESAVRIDNQPAKATASCNLSSCPQHNKIKHNLE